MDGADRKDVKVAARKIQETARHGTESIARTADKAPPAAYIAAAGGSALVSLFLLVRNRKGTALLVGVWPAILSLAMLLKNRRPSHEVAQSTPLGGADGALLAE
jgi:site-specific recombinase